jgi:hypothetical protein
VCFLGIGATCTYLNITTLQWIFLISLSQLYVSIII